ncbi:DMT family transporter [Stutzerimonas kirkiae]|uniref:EamA family transporter n=1 Tax=Stutzerimonas kirkiae TaxID=2211392 RepID=A0A4Q9R8Z1_9GAMM|nr:DMT family transporter [Stutzerimonas kirkiae]TBU96550.1 EamA family transporter [Stutzerimonas kirkiae]TBV02207.1 EamA family transporter [Stutzerimonas kirkiae]TBV08881.1 EamA family transporter [Stutzerimonas kirkiae]TBV15861.1 EamA family transporter [Stutzerimonas kirkiae]
MTTPLKTSQCLSLTALAMLAFAGNSLLCRAALDTTSIDAATFTLVRLLAGALMLEAILRLGRKARPAGAGDWRSALALFAYAAGFSWAYIGLATATGALLLFGAVQLSMVGWAIWRGERLRAWQWGGFALAVAGLVIMLLPGIEAPSWQDASLMLLAGVAWAVYSVRGRSQPAPLVATTRNFWRAGLLAALMCLPFVSRLTLDTTGLVYAVLAGALASGVGYTIWYGVMQQLSTASAASVQLSVPVISALGAVGLLDEALTARLLLSSLAILGGVALVILAGRHSIPVIR